MTAISYTVNGVVYPTQASLEKSIRTHLKAAPFNATFIDAFLAAVVNTYHPEVIKAGQRSTGRFLYLTAREQIRLGHPHPDRIRGGNLMTAWFEPLGDWRDCTMYPWRGSRNIRSDIKAALRQKLQSWGLPRPGPADQCARQPCASRALEYEHVEPTFDQIAEQCLAYMTDEEIETKFGYSKFVRGRDELCDLMPDDHPAIMLLEIAHTRNRWEWLCAYHHRNVAAAAPSTLQSDML